MIKMSASEKRTAILGIGFVLIFSLCYWVIIPTWRQYEDIATELTKLKNTQSQSESLAGMQEGFADKVIAYQEAYEQLKSRYLCDMDEKTAVIKFLGLVEQLTKSTQVEIISETTGINEVEGFKTVNVNMTVRCTSGQLTNLLEAYSTSETNISVDRLRIDVEEQNQLLQVRLTVSTLIITENEETAEEGEANGAEH